MRKLFVAMLYLFVIFIITQVVVLYFRGEHEVIYEIDGDDVVFEVLEKYVYDGPKSHYYFEIEVSDEKFYLQTYQLFYRSEKIIRDIKFKQTEKMSCLLPIFLNERLVTDMICHYDEGVYNYTYVRGVDSEIDDFVWNLFNYDDMKFSDQTTNILTEDYMSVYLDHVLENHFLYLDDYRGIGTVNRNNLRRYAKVSLFRDDVYNMQLKYLLNEHLIIANYNQDIDFDQFRIVNIRDNSIEDVELETMISFNSYFQGHEGDLAYIYDRENQVQYQFNIKTKNLTEVGNAELGVNVLQNSEWVELTVSDLFENDYYFTYDLLPGNGYEKVKRIFGETGFIYYISYENEEYHVYRALGRNKEYKKHLFSTENNNIKFSKDFVYYQDGDFIRYYSDQTGVKTIVENQEFSFNENLGFGIFISR